ncbi:unnamed protein product [Lampetra planeri]
MKPVGCGAAGEPPRISATSATHRREGGYASAAEATTHWRESGYACVEKAAAHRKESGAIFLRSRANHVASWRFAVAGEVRDIMEDAPRSNTVGQTPQPWQITVTTQWAHMTLTSPRQRFSASHLCSCSGTTVDCYSRSLASVPAGIPTTTRVLGLSSNQITKLEPGVFDRLTALVEARATEAPAIARAIVNLWSPHLSLDTNDAGDIQCSCSGTEVNCQWKRLAFVPAGIPTTTRDLWLGGNQITKLEPGGV